MNKIKSLGIFVGTGRCNARCKHCAGVPLRQYALKIDGTDNFPFIEKNIRECYFRGARSISLSSSGEPTLSERSVSNVLCLLNKLRIDDGLIFNNINLYSNGIRIGSDDSFLKTLEWWSKLGLQTIYITVHDTNSWYNAKRYNVYKYPSLPFIISRIHDCHIKVRANLILGQNNIHSFAAYKINVLDLINMGVDSIASWKVRDLDDKISLKNAIDSYQFDLIREWVNLADFPIPVRLYEEEKRQYTYGQKLTLFQNGVLSNTWCT